MSLEFTANRRVIYADTDKMGVVYNGNYLSYFEIGRNELMRHLGLAYTEVEKSGLILPVIDAYVKYIKPAYYDDVLVIKAQLNETLSAKIQFIYTISCNNVLIAEGYTNHVFANAETMKPVRPPKMYVELLQKHLGNL